MLFMPYSNRATARIRDALGIGIVDQLIHALKPFPRMVSKPSKKAEAMQQLLAKLAPVLLQTLPSTGRSNMRTV